jgi:hypothetical protein
MEKTKEIPTLNVDDLFPIDDHIRNQEKDFVRRFKEKTKIDILKGDQLFVISNNDLLFLISVIVRDYESFRFSNQLNSPTQG